MNKLKKIVATRAKYKYREKIDFERSIIMRTLGCMNFNRNELSLWTIKTIIVVVLKLMRYVCLFLYLNIR